MKMPLAEVKQQNVENSSTTQLSAATTNNATDFKVKPVKAVAKLSVQEPKTTI